MGHGAPLPVQIRDQLIDGLRQFPGAHAFLAKVDDQFVGVCTCFEGFSTFRGARLINIHDLCVLPLNRGRGVGKAMLSFIEAWARSQGFCRLTLEVRSDNAAKRLYERSGFSSNTPAPSQMLYLCKSL
jgi:GNAT superfamily N-acetyltransferase